MENSMEGPQKIKNGTITWSKNPTSRYLSEGNENYLKVMSALPCSALFTIAKIWKQFKCSLSDKWWRISDTHTHTHTHTHRNIIQPRERRMDLEGIYAKWSKTQKNKYCIMSFICGVLKTQRVEWWLPGARSRGDGEVLTKGHKCSAIRWISSGDLIYGITSTVSNTVLHTSKSLYIMLF